MTTDMITSAPVTSTALHKTGIKGIFSYINAGAFLSKSGNYF